MQSQIIDNTSYRDLKYQTSERRKLIDRHQSQNVCKYRFEQKTSQKGSLTLLIKTNSDLYNSKPVQWGSERKENIIPNLQLRNVAFQSEGTKSATSARVNQSDIPRIPSFVLSE